jgi:hypothetical protein
VRYACLALGLAVAGLAMWSGPSPLRLRVDPLVANQGGKMTVVCRVGELQRRAHVWMGIYGAGGSEAEFDSTEPQVFRRTYTVGCGNGPAYCQLGSGERITRDISVGCN